MAARSLADYRQPQGRERWRLERWRLERAHRDRVHQHLSTRRGTPGAGPGTLDHVPSGGGPAGGAEGVFVTDGAGASGRAQDFIARLAALVPPPRVHLTRFHGVFAAHAALRAAITPAGRGTGAQKRVAAPERPASKDIRMNWARRRKRVFGIEIEQCVRCGGRLKVIASIEEPALIERILAHRRERGEAGAPTASFGGASAAAGVFRFGTYWSTISSGAGNNVYLGRRA